MSAMEIPKSVSNSEIIHLKETLPPVVLRDRFDKVLVVPMWLDHSLRGATSRTIDVEAAEMVNVATHQVMSAPDHKRAEEAKELRQRFPLLEWIKENKSSWPVMDAIITNAASLMGDPIRTDGYGDTDRKGELLPDWLVYDKKNGKSIRDVSLGNEVAIFDTWDVAVGVAERARGFQRFYEDSLKHKIYERIAENSTEQIVFVDFASGSYRYAIQALHMLLLNDPALARKITGDPSRKDRILLKLIGVDQDPAAKRYADALAKKLLVGEYVDNVTHQVSQVEGLFDGQTHQILQPDTLVDGMTSSGLIDYFNGVNSETAISKASFVVEMRNRLKIGGVYCNANIAKLSPNSGTNYTEQDVLRTLFRWYKMYEVNPEEFVSAHLRGIDRGGWHPDELNGVTVLPSCSRNVDRSFMMISGVRRHDHKYMAFSQSGLRRLNS